jgi:hypothetical protein
MPQVAPDRGMKIFSGGEEIFANYSRVVIGDRGPYIEADLQDVILDNLFIPEKEKYRVENKWWWNRVYYLEFRTKHSGAMVYWQRRTVKYADYIVGKWYISPYDATNGRGGPFIHGHPPKDYERPKPEEKFND